MPSALLLVRAELKDLGDRAAFDHWYQSEHLPAALEAFGAETPGGAGPAPRRRSIMRSTGLAT